MRSSPTCRGSAGTRRKDVDMNWATIMGVVTGVMLLAYLGVVVWAYRKDRRDDFEEASRYPFFDEEGRS